MRLYFRYLAMSLKGQMQYKASFAMGMSAQLLNAFTVLAGVGIMLSLFKSVAEFNLEEIFICFAAINMSHALAEFLGRGFDTFPQMLANGELDRLLVRPRGVVFQTFAHRTEFARLIRVLMAVAVLAWAMPRCGIAWTWDRWLTLGLMVLCGAFVFFGLFLLYAAFSFFTVEGLEFMNILTHGGNQFGRYPFAVYGRGVLRFLTFAVPLALCQYWPLLYLLGREESMAYMAAPLASLVFVAPCMWFFRFGLRRHRSTGS